MPTVDPKIVDKIQELIDDDVVRVDAQDGDDYANFWDSCGMPIGIDTLIKQQDPSLQHEYEVIAYNLLEKKCEELG